MNKFLESWHKERGRVIIFSGVFDPVHKGHLAIAKKASALHGRQVVFLPERIPTHKHGATAFEHRLAMLRLACQNEKDFEVYESPYEHHTIDETLTWLQTQFQGSQNFGLLIGSDVAGYIMKWEGIAELSKYGVDKLIVASRATNVINNIPKFEIPGVKVAMLRARYNYMASSIIRADFGSHQTSLPKSVAEYAQSNKIY